MTSRPIDHPASASAALGETAGAAVVGASVGGTLDDGHHHRDLVDALRLDPGDRELRHQPVHRHHRRAVGEGDRDRAQGDLAPLRRLIRAGAEVHEIGAEAERHAGMICGRRHAEAPVAGDQAIDGERKPGRAPARGRRRQIAGDGHHRRAQHHLVDPPAIRQPGDAHLDPPASHLEDRRLAARRHFQLFTVTLCGRSARSGSFPSSRRSSEKRKRTAGVSSPGSRKNRPCRATRRSMLHGGRFPLGAPERGERRPRSQQRLVQHEQVDMPAGDRPRREADDDAPGREDGGTVVRRLQST